MINVESGREIWEEESRNVLNVRANPRITAARSRSSLRWRSPNPFITASIAPASVEPEPVSHAIGEERDSFSLGQEASGGLVLPPAYQDLEPIQVEDDGLPGVEYDLVLTAPPNGSIKCLGVVTTISEGRNDLPITDSDWAGIVFGDDEA